MMDTIIYGIRLDPVAYTLAQLIQFVVLYFVGYAVGYNDGPKKGGFR